MTKESIGAAKAHFEKALTLDPDSASLNALVGFTHAVDARFASAGGRSARRSADGGGVLRAGPRSTPTTPTAISEWPSSTAGPDRFDEAVAEARRAVALAPGSADIADFASLVLTQSGYPAEAAALSEKAIALSPHHQASYFGVLGHAYRLCGRTEEAIAAFNAYHARSPGFGLVDLVIVYQETGRTEEAKETARALMAARPGCTIASYAATQRRRDKARVAAELDALREAGLPEG